MAKNNTIDDRMAPNDFSFDIVMVPGASWWTPLWTNRQHLAKAISQHFPGCRVLYVDPGESLASWFLHPRSVAGELGRFRGILDTFHQIDHNLWVLKSWTPFPYQRKSLLTFKLSRSWMVRQSRHAIKRLGFRDIILLLQWEYGLPFIKGMQSSFVCYDRLNDHPNLPHNDMRREMVVSEEAAIFQASQLITAVSTDLLPKKYESWVSKSHVVPPGVDIVMIRDSMDDTEARIPALFAGHPRPYIGYHGNLTEYRLCLNIIDDLAQRRENWTWILVGPQEKNNQKLQKLAQRPNVILPGFVPHKEVFRAYIRWFDVLLLPYHFENRFLGPTMKSGEYLATGKPIVSSYHDLFQDFEKLGFFRLARTVDEFEAEIEAALKEDDKQLGQLRIEEAEKHSWQNRALKMLTLIKEYQT